MDDQYVITRQVTVAAGVFALGYLGELTQIVPFKMVDQALAATGTAQARLRVLPSRVVVYRLLAGPSHPPAQLQSHPQHQHRHSAWTLRSVLREGELGRWRRAKAP